MARFPLSILLFFAMAAGASANGNDVHTPRDMPRVFVPTLPPNAPTVYPWRKDIKATVFWVGERPGENNPVPNCMSSWDKNWKFSFGGYDDPSPSNREDFRPKEFVPGLNPFYIALPYNDVLSQESWRSEASKVIPWFNKVPKEPGKSVCKGRWLAIRSNNRVCYAQWEDVGPFRTDDWQYVFGTSRPATSGNGGAGIDVSPAVRDFLKMDSSAVVDWRFVELEEVEPGPWRRWGANNHFVLLREKEAQVMTSRVARLNAQRDAWVNATMPVIR